MKTALVLSLAAAAALGAALLFVTDRIPSPPLEDGLLEPRIHRVGNQRMLVLPMRGDPDVAAGKAFSALFKAYFKEVPGAWKDRPDGPRARWAADLAGRPKEEWQGRYALPLPAGARVSAPDGLSIEEWEYGLVAEILHVGSYDDEAAAIGRLQEHIRQEGYRISGDHEEIYLKGPGMFFRGNPARYQTLIRYRVEKAP